MGAGKPRGIPEAYVLAEAWKDHDPAALNASERIRYDVYHKNGIDTRDVGVDFAQLAWGPTSANDWLIKEPTEFPQLIHSDAGHHPAEHKHVVVR